MKITSKLEDCKWEKYCNMDAMVLLQTMKTGGLCNRLRLYTYTSNEHGILKQYIEVT
jgi:hypothetical protein